MTVKHLTDYLTCSMVNTHDFHILHILEKFLCINVEMAMKISCYSTILLKLGLDEGEAE